MVWPFAAPDHTRHVKSLPAQAQDAGPRLCQHGQFASLLLGYAVSCCQGLPFAVAGVGDLIALFRCISCRYNFSTTTNAPDLLGAPGRVFATGEVRELRCKLSTVPRLSGIAKSLRRP